MSKTGWFTGALVLTALTSFVLAESEQFKQYQRDYDILHQDLLNHDGEVAEVNDFVYIKDIATFTFLEGKLHFQRYVNGRPTTAIFIGDGHARIAVPSHVERQTLRSITRDSTVDVTFNTCFIRMADDFDRRVKEKFPCQAEQLSWSDFNLASKQDLGEYFFKPVVFHLYDNYFQLLRSAYERQADGYFYMKFQRYGFSFDPNRPEEVHVSYEREGGDIVAADGAVVQRLERNIYDDSAMSRIEYATSLISKRGQFEMGGSAGNKIVHGEATLKLMVAADSVKFLSLFLDTHLKIDSIRCNGRPVEYFRRKDFRFVGGILPQYAHKMDTLDVQLWYKGSDYQVAFPCTEDSRAVPHGLRLVSDDEVGFLLPDSVEVKPLDGNRQELITVTSRPYSSYCFYGTAYQQFDTVTIHSDAGLPINIFFDSRNRKRYLDETENVTQASFNFFSSLLGPPSHSSRFSVLYSDQADMPGVITGPGGRNDDFIGGLYQWLGLPIARQWFPRAIAGVTHRETWLFEALPAYLDLMLVQDKAGTDIFYNNLLQRRNVLYAFAERDRDLPLAIGSRVPATLRVHKGIWLLHMLRWIMYDLQHQSDDRFRAFLTELSTEVTKPGFTNSEFVTLAEKHVGGSLESFFHYWLYGTGMPEYEVSYVFEQRGDEYFISVEVSDRCDDGPCRMPVIVRIVESDQITFARQLIRGPHDHFTLGPFASKPTEFHFNEFFSVLSKDEVHQK